MNELNGNKASEKVTQLLDGELPASEESQLFSELSLNEELRSEFRDMVSIKNAIQNDTEAFVPPVSATAAVFQKAGYALPGAYFSGLKTMFVKYAWIPVLVAVLTGFTTFSVMKNRENSTLAAMSQKIETLQNQLLASDSKISDLTAENQRLEIAANKPSEIREVVKYVKVPVVTSRELISTAENETKNDEIINNNANNDNLTEFSLSTHQEEKNSRANLLQNENMTYNSGYGQLNPAYYPLDNKPNPKSEKYYMSFRGMAAAAYPQVDVDSPEEFSNFSISFLFLSPYEDTYIGVEAGREPFSQQFYNVDEDGKKYLYEQRPNVWWGGAGFVANFGRKIDALFDARPYGRLLLGASELGPLGKVSAGLSWKSDAWGLGAFLGLEGSLMGYQNQGQWYSSQKFGITYGMSIQF